MLRGTIQLSKPEIAVAIQALSDAGEQTASLYDRLLAATNIQEDHVTVYMNEEDAEQILDLLGSPAENIDINATSLRTKTQEFLATLRHVG
ncbi:MAG: hypothetical protein ACOCXT_02710 [Candidatus Dojkabacteria bacterium]